MATSGVHEELLEAEIKKFEAYPKETIEYYLSILRAPNREARLEALPEEEQSAVLNYELLALNIERMVQERVRKAHLVKVPSEPNFRPALIFAARQVIIEDVDSESSEDQSPRKNLIRRKTQ
ncbi:MAG: hypothetical protein AB7I18_10380 [Candidatus Berkiella sp.]